MHHNTSPNFFLLFTIKVHIKMHIDVLPVNTGTIAHLLAHHSVQMVTAGLCSFSVFSAPCQ